MAHLALSNTDDWELEYADSQDIRGYRALGQDGQDTGARVADLLIDTDEERVVTVVLDDGRKYPARDISIGDDVIYITGDYPVNDASARRASDIENFGIVVMRG